MKPTIVETLNQLRQMERQKELMSKLLSIRVTELDAALLQDDEKKVEMARQNLLAQFEAGVDLKIKQSREISKLESQYAHL